MLKNLCASSSDCSEGPSEVFPPFSLSTATSLKPWNVRYLATSVLPEASVPEIAINMDLCLFVCNLVRISYRREVEINYVDFQRRFYIVELILSINVE